MNPLTWFRQLAAAAARNRAIREIPQLEQALVNSAARMVALESVTERVLAHFTVDDWTDWGDAAESCATATSRDAAVLTDRVVRLALRVEPDRIGARPS